MNDRTTAADGQSAGSLLRQAREKQGLHISALAAAIKVAPRKLDALENDRWDELPDTTFTRALAQTVCRTLKIDPAPVLALLPSTDPHRLDTVGGSLNMPFSTRDGRSGTVAAAAVRPMALGGLLLLVAAIGVYLMPAGVWTGSERDETLAGVSAPAAATASAALEAASQTLTTAAALASSAGAASAAAAEPLAAALGGAVVSSAGATTAPLVLPGRPATAPATGVQSVAMVQPPAGIEPAKAGVGDGPVKLRALQPTWISARDATGNVLLSRLLDTGESVALGGSLPLRLTIGNAAGTELDFRGQKVDLTARAKDNVVRLELQ